MVEQIKQLRGELNESKYLPKKEVQAIKKWVYDNGYDASVDMVSDLWDSKEKLVKRILDNVPKKDHKEMIDGLKKAGLYESVNEYDQWRNTRIQSKNIFRMLKQKYNNNIPKMEKGLETILKQNKTKNDQAEVVRQEFKKYFKIKESVNERAPEPEIDRSSANFQSTIRQIKAVIKQAQQLLEYMEQTGGYSDNRLSVYLNKGLITRKAKELTSATKVTSTVLNDELKTYERLYNRWYRNNSKG